MTKVRKTFNGVSARSGFGFSRFQIDSGRMFVSGFDIRISGFFFAPALCAFARITAIPCSSQIRLFLCLILLAGWISACASVTGNNVEHDAVGTSRRTADFSSPVAMSDSSDLERLAALWEKRRAESLDSKYPLGPGDTIVISVPAMEELANHTVRVASDGTITLPLLGKVQASNLTEDGLRENIGERLKDYMYSPRVNVIVKEYHSREVAVLGAVPRPGLYALNTGTDSILDMISRAGGVSTGVDRIYLIPAEEVPAEEAGLSAVGLPEKLLSKDPKALLLKRTDPIIIDIKELAFGAQQVYLSLPARPGDVIMVPGGSQVLVEGWVEKPGAYNITHGLTVSGAVAAAGGPLFPADTTAVRLLRNERKGKKTALVVDLGKIKRGEEPDVTLQGGDIVEVSSNDAKLISYGLYQFFSSIIKFGVGGTVPLLR